MKEFNPMAYESSGAYCSKPCGEECAVANLIPPYNIQGAMTVDEVLVEHDAEEIRSAAPEKLGEWISEADQFPAGFATNDPIEHDLVFRSITRIARGECPNYKLK